MRSAGFLALLQLAANPAAAAAARPHRPPLVGVVRLEAYVLQHQEFRQKLAELPAQTPPPKAEQIDAQEVRLWRRLLLEARLAARRVAKRNGLLLILKATNPLSTYLPQVPSPEIAFSLERSSPLAYCRATHDFTAQVLAEAQTPQVVEQEPEVDASGFPVAAVNMTTLVHRLQETRAAETLARQLFGERQAQAAALSAQARQLRQELETSAKNEPLDPLEAEIFPKIVKQREVEIAANRLLRALARDLDDYQVTTTKETLEKVQRALQRVARARRLQLVLKYWDDHETITQARTVAELLEADNLTPALFISPRIDTTDQLIQELNERFHRWGGEKRYLEEKKKYFEESFRKRAAQEKAEKGNPETLKKR